MANGEQSRERPEREPGQQPGQTAAPTAHEAMAAYRQLREYARARLAAREDRQPVPEPGQVRQAETVWLRWCTAHEVDWPATSPGAREHLARQLESP